MAWIELQKMSRGVFFFVSASLESNRELMKIAAVLRVFSFRVPWNKVAAGHRSSLRHRQNVKQLIDSRVPLCGAFRISLLRLYWFCCWSAAGDNGTTPLGLILSMNHWSDDEGKLNGFAIKISTQQRFVSSRCICFLTFAACLHLTFSSNCYCYYDSGGFRRRITVESPLYPHWAVWLLPSTVLGGDVARATSESYHPAGTTYASPRRHSNSLTETNSDQKQ